jgi:hypothetical protein
VAPSHDREILFSQAAVTDMPMFVHLTQEKNINAILRNGVSRLRKRSGRPPGVYAMPVTRNFFVSHQWLRELKRRGPGAIAGVYFRIPDDEIVWVGHYNQAHQQMTAAEAAALMSRSETQDELREGYEVIIPRRIGKTEIKRARILPQVVGWRYYPGAHGKRPCGCPFCQRGNYGARRLRNEYEKS